MDILTIPEKLSKAKAGLVCLHPFFASLVLSVRMVEDAATAKWTMATDGETFYYDPTFLAPLTLSETIFLLAHEALHGAFEHMYNRGDRDQDLWNQACDYVINDLLTREKKGTVGAMPRNGLLNSALVQEAGGSAEGVYRILKERQKSQPQGQGKGQGQGKPGQGKGQNQPAPGAAFDHLIDSCPDDATREQKRAEARIKVLQAASAAKAAGNLSAGLELVVKELTKTPVDWRSVLHRFFTEKLKTDLTYSRPKRRFLAEDIYLPSLTGEGLGEIVIAVDCSGSCGHVIDSFGAELQAVKESTNPKTVHVLYFDTKVLRHDTFNQDDTLGLKPIGGGGTEFSPIWEAIANAGINPMACVVLTDLYASDFGEAPEYPVLWASVASQNAPFGEVVEVKE